RSPVNGVSKTNGRRAMKKHTIAEYVQNIEDHNLLVSTDYYPEFGEQIVQKVAYNSGKTGAKTLFVCKGAAFKADYLDGAIKKGAIAYISEQDYQRSIPCILVKDIQKALSLVSTMYFGHPADRLNLVGITGTKGKSTTAYYVKYILDEVLKSSQVESGIISSIDTYDGKIKEESHLTTPESLELQMHFNNAASKKLQYMVMEVSSQALKYGRVYDVMFDVSVFLNISEDHISPIEHTDLDDYFEAKLRIFKQSRIACVNLQTDYVDRVLEAAVEAGRVITFGTTPNADVYGYAIEKDGLDTIFKVRTDKFDREFRLTMPGLFNVENALAAIAVAYALNIPETYIYDGLVQARASGRMELYTTDQEGDVIIIVDYAHNKLSFNKLYESVKAEYPDRKIFTVFGCPGGKAYIRRKDLGLLSGQHSEKVFLTAEDPGYEPVRDICEDIAQYVRQYTENYEIIEDREEAIRSSIMESDANTVIVITGKGNETRQKIGKEYVPCASDVDFVKKHLKEYSNVNK
ncbi:MAG: Mur ligase family protein, partial [Ignavibacteriales bacterium]